MAQKLKKKNGFCSYCGKPILIRNWQFVKYKNHFCCVECQQRYAKENHINQFLNPVPCKYCGNIFKPTTRANIFCSHKCWSDNRRKKPEIVLKEDYAVVVIQHKNEFFEVMIDAEDVEKCKKYSWQLLNKRNKFLYFRNCEKQLLHRYIMNCPDDMVVDHINHNTLDNRKENLRICTFKENIDNKNLINKNNKTGYTYITTQYSKFIVRVKGKRIGVFQKLETALKARNKYLKELGYDVDNNE